MRVRTLFSFAALTLPLAVACSSEPSADATTSGAGADSAAAGSGTGGGSSKPPGPDEWNREVTKPTDDEAAIKRAACGYGVGSLPAETQGESHPSGTDIPVDHIVVLMMENRSFDHYFQKLPEYGQPDADVAPPGFSNPDPDGKPVAPFHLSQHCFVDTNHSWAGTHDQFGDGKMDGFVKTNDGWHEVPANGTLDMIKGDRAMGYHDETDLPFYYWLANEYAIADRYFCSVLGPTLPNRMYLYAASSFGYTYNSIISEQITLFDHLTAREVDWKVYADGPPSFATFVDEYLEYGDHIFPIEEFFVDAAAGKLPSVAFLDPDFASTGAAAKNDEHPPAVAQVGQQLSANIVDSLSKSPNWARSALFLTYDEHGGLYDHVPPPPACAPDDLTPMSKMGPVPGAFDRYGIRVPLTVVSPFAKKHFVGHKTYDHTSIVRFIEARHVMPALSNRDANAEAPWELFDFENPPHATPPAVTIPPVDMKVVGECETIWGE